MIAVVDYHKGNLKSVERGIEGAGGRAFVTDDAAAIAQADAIVLPGVGAFADAAASMQALGQMDVIRRRIAAGVPFLGICLGMHLMFEEGMEGAPDEDDDRSTHNARGLAVLPGVVGPLPRTDAQGRPYKIPHVGWNSVEFCNASDCHPERSALPVSSRAERSVAEGSHAAAAGSATGLASRAGSLDCAPFGRSARDDSSPCPLFAGVGAGTYFYFTHGFAVPDGPFAVAETTHSVTFPCAVQYGEAAFGVQFHPEKSSDAGAALLRNFVNIVKGA